MKPLYQLTEEFENIWYGIMVAAEQGDGVIPPDMKQMLDSINIDIALKIENCCKVIADMESRAEACKNEAARLNAQRKSAEGHAEWLREYIKSSMTARGVEKQQAGLFKVSIQKNSDASLEITQEFDIPHRFWRQPPAEIDKAELKAALKEGQEIHGAELRHGTHLRIR